MHRWRPPRRLRLSAWADEHYYLSAESAAEPGRWHTLPYQGGIMDAFTDPHVEQVSVMKSARVGYTKCLNALVGYYMHQDPCPIMVVQPTLEDAKGHSREEIAPMLRDCPTLAALVPEARSKDADNTILQKLFPGGSLSLVGANSARGFRRVSRKVVLFDEIDGYPPSAGAEGDQIKLGLRRTEYYWDRKIGYGSTPTVAGRSRIERLFEAGDQRRYYVPCPHCEVMQVLQFKQFRWPKGRPEDAVYVCLDCGAEIDHSHKRAMVEAGEWRPGPHPQFPIIPPPGPFHGHASFHIWAAYSFSPNATWGQLCAEFVDAEKKPDELKTFVNTVLGETWQEKGDAPEWERLYQRRESYPIGTAPLGVLFLTAGVDVQKDRLFYEIVGWGRGKESWSIEAGVIPGDIATADAQKQLDALLARTIQSDSGVILPIGMLAIDSGYNTQAVYNWARRHALTKVIAVKGVDTSNVLVGTPRPVDVSVSGRVMRRGYRVWPVSSKVAKAELYGWLKLQPPTDESRAAGETFPPGFCHHPEYGEDYFKQLTAEQLVPHRKRNGFTAYEWEQIPGRENHYLDTRVYARSAAAVVGLDRFSEADWCELERDAGQEQLALPLADGAASAETTATSSSASPGDTPPAAAASAWLRRRRRWLR
jgi:phage terminase large subunit GpA-like protein